MIESSIDIAPLASVRFFYDDFLMRVFGFGLISICSFKLKERDAWPNVGKLDLTFD
jgi:hypothetical protein